MFHLLIGYLDILHIIMNFTCLSLIYYNSIIVYFTENILIIIYIKKMVSTLLVSKHVLC